MNWLGPENLKNSRPKKLVKSNKSILFRKIPFLAVFLVQKLIFGHFWNRQKCNLVKKLLIYLISRVFWPGLFQIFWPAMPLLPISEFQRNASKFAIYYIYENPKLLFPFFISCYLAFSPNECPGLCALLSKVAQNEKCNFGLSYTTTKSIADALSQHVRHQIQRVTG